MSGDWVPCESYGTAVTVGAGGLFSNIVLVQTRQGAGATPTVTQAVEDEADVVVMRIVGQIWISSAAATFYRERIRTGIRDNAGLNAFFAGNFASGIDANEPFLWERGGRLTAGGDTADPNRAHPYWCHVDVKVGRRLSQEMALFYSISNVGANALTYIPWLRTYARSVS